MEKRGAAVPPTVYLDLDGVLADFVAAATAVLGEHPESFEAREGAGAMWARILVPGFYASLPPTPDADELWRGVVRLTGRAPTILTGVPRVRGRGAAAEKLAWARARYPGAALIACAAREKARHCLPGDFLIDDRPRFRSLWEAAGGVWITHVSAAESLAALEAVLAEKGGDG